MPALASAIALTSDMQLSWPIVLVLLGGAATLGRLLSRVEVLAKRLDDCEDRVREQETTSARVSTEIAVLTTTLGRIEGTMTEFRNDFRAWLGSKPKDGGVGST